MHIKIHAFNNTFFILILQPRPYREHDPQAETKNKHSDTSLKLLFQIGGIIARPVGKVSIIIN